MAGNYQLWMTTDNGERIAQLDYSLGFSASITTNGIGRLTLSLPVTFDTTLLAVDRMIQVWRQPTGGALSLWRPYFLRRWKFLTQTNGGETLTLYGADPNELLTRRIVAAYSGSAQASKTDYADDMMKVIVTEAMSNAVAPIPAAGTRTWGNLSVADDLSQAPSIHDSFAFEYLLRNSGGGLLADISKAAKIAGGEVFFDVGVKAVTSNSISFEFATRMGQPGADVSNRVIFDQVNDNLRNASLDFDYSDEVTYVYGGGQGEGSARVIQQAYDSTRYGASIWNRREAMADARNQATAAGVLSAARTVLDAGKPQLRFAGTPVDTQGTRFGIDWNYGDRVTASYHGYTFTAIIRMVNITVDSDGEEVITARFDSEGV